MQATTFILKPDFYHSLLDSFLESARVNPDSFFELRIQSGILRHKFTTTERPDGIRSRNQHDQMAFFRNTAPPAMQQQNPRASFYNLPAAHRSAQPLVQRISAANNRTRLRTPAAKRLHATILSPEADKSNKSNTNTGNITSPTIVTDDATVQTSPTPNPPLMSTPEIARDPDHASVTYSVSDDEQYEEIVSSQFTSPNPFACLAEMDNPESEKCESPAEKSETILREVPTSPPPPVTELDLSNIEKKCSHCKEPLPLHVYRIDDILADTFADVKCTLHCKSCNVNSTHLLPSKSDPVKKFVRENYIWHYFSPPLLVNCSNCKKPDNIEILNIPCLEKNEHNKDKTKLHINFNCSSCKCEGQILEHYKCAPIQDFLFKVFQERTPYQPY